MESEYQRRLNAIYVDVVKKKYVDSMSYEARFQQLHDCVADLLELLMEEDELKQERVSETKT